MAKRLNITNIRIRIKIKKYRSYFYFVHFLKTLIYKLLDLLINKYIKKILTGTSSNDEESKHCILYAEKLLLNLINLYLLLTGLNWR